MRSDDTLEQPLEIIRRAPLTEPPMPQVDRVVRRIVGGDSLTGKLDVAAFQSAH